jgi:hypothetical protein
VQCDPSGKALPFDLENLIGATCALNVIHAEDKQEPGKWWANIGSIMALPEGMKPMDPGSFVRFKDREKDGGEVVPF